MELLDMIIEVLNTKDTQKINEKILSIHPYDVASILKDLDDEQLTLLFKSLNNEQTADIIAYIEDDEDAKELFEKLGIDKSAEIISEMETDDAADIINTLDEDTKEELAKKLDKDVVEDIKELAKYDEDMTGSIMTNNFFTLNVKDKVSEAMKKLVKEVSDQEVIDTLFIVDDEDHFLGTIDLKDLIIARKNELIKDIFDKNNIHCEDTDSIVDAVKTLKEYDLLVLPVTHNDILKGIVTIDDAIDILDEESNDDYDKLAGLAGENDTTLKNVLKSRIPWLLILLVLSFIVSSVLGLFEGVIASATILVFFQTLILDMGGNSGTQSLASSVICLSKNELDKKGNTRKHLGRELASGALNGLILGIMAFGITFVFMLIRGDDVNKPMVSLIIGLSMMIGIFISNFIGSLVPIVLNKLKIDPAVASGPFITTLNDMLGVIIYYSLAYLILIQGGIL